ncbi:hypothetical protein AGABI2DRAFT_177459 [Agaricus bisporus var. bisporus H97]|uniref:hypothetical protein n=1 Tax=Agaricus bisporus var. bisporus (strain H97 / ATCC MYA-4626 / FGSC 10389) TaxID=936046 RepID=UPI00029F7524|nr:hypothetical protein AGABI2DRAFT_177459 [Agaricus bisporus var. bisporus H97]EKV49479.1 hypothetical protein AGABI2DRAFT_177459 [Agaricus bisporus var. bisporus H97]
MSTTETSTEIVPAQQEQLEIRAKQAPRPPKNLRPARKQVKPGDIVKTETVQTGKEYNIWYNKWAGGDREDNYSNKTKSQSRCQIKLDSGLTRANTTGNKYTCLFFSRGCCPYGWECEYLHCLPNAVNTLPDTSKDCFARDKFADYRDDMGGVGSFNRQNRTLYVGRIKETGAGPETEEVVIRHFKEWGDIERIRVLQYRSVAFVTYVNELSAQFAKEAMACQSLDNDEILNVRWATEDPNPTQKVAEKRRLEELGQEAIRSRMDPRIVEAMRAVRALEEGDTLDDEGNFVEEQNGNKRRRIENENGDVGSDSDEEMSGPPAVRQRLPAEDESTQPQGLLSAGALEGLKYFAEIRKKNDIASAPPQTQVKSSTPGLGLGDYGSDDDD